MNWDTQGPLVAALAAAVVWLTLELRRAQGEAAEKVQSLLSARDQFLEKVGKLYEDRLEELRELLQPRQTAEP